MGRVCARLRVPRFHVFVRGGGGGRRAQNAQEVGDREGRQGAAKVGAGAQCTEYSAARERLLRHPRNLIERVVHGVDRAGFTIGNQARGIHNINHAGTAGRSGVCTHAHAPSHEIAESRSVKTLCCCCCCCCYVSWGRRTSSGSSSASGSKFNLWRVKVQRRHAHPAVNSRYSDTEHDRNINLRVARGDFRDLRRGYVFALETKRLAQPERTRESKAQ